MTATTASWRVAITHFLRNVNKPLLDAIETQATGTVETGKEPAAFAVYGQSDEFGVVLLPNYCGSIQVIRERVMEAARREKFTGDFVQRMASLGWWLEPLYAAPVTTQPDKATNDILAAGAGSGE